MDSVYNFVVHNSGDLTESSFGITAVISIGNNKSIGDYQLYPAYYPSKSGSNFAQFKPEIREKLVEENQCRDLMLSMLLLLHPKSRGTITQNGA